MRAWREKNCDEAYWQQQYAKQTPKRKKSVKQALKKLRIRNREWLDRIKSVPCTDCGRIFPPVCMDFDHVRGKKLGDVATMATHARSLKIIEAEIAKCEIVCACCHRLRTSRRNLGG